MSVFAPPGGDARLSRGSWPEPTSFPGQTSAGAPTPSGDAEGPTLAPADFANLVAALAEAVHYLASADTWRTRSISASQNNAVLVSAADPKRIGLAIQLPASLSAWIGANNQVSPSPTGQSPGYLLPVGGGWVFGPENTLDVYLIESAAAQQDIRILELFKA